MDFPILYSIHGDQKVFPTLCKFFICEGEGFGPTNRSTQGQHRNGRRGQWPTVLCGCYRSSPKRANWGKGRPTCVSVCAFLIAWWSENTANKKKPLYCLSVSCAYVFSFSLSAKLLYSRRESRRRPDNTQQSLSWHQCLRAPPCVCWNEKTRDGGNKVYLGQPNLKPITKSWQEKKKKNLLRRNPTSHLYLIIKQAESFQSTDISIFCLFGIRCWNTRPRRRR